MDKILLDSVHWDVEDDEYKLTFTNGVVLPGVEISSDGSEQLMIQVFSTSHLTYHYDKASGGSSWIQNKNFAKEAREFAKEMETLAEIYERFQDVATLEMDRENGIFEYMLTGVTIPRLEEMYA